MKLVMLVSLAMLVVCDWALGAAVSSGQPVVPVTVKTIMGKNIEIMVDLSDPVSLVKMLIEAKEGIPIGEQRLVYAGKDLEDERSLSDYNIQKDSTIHLAVKLRSGFMPDLNAARAVDMIQPHEPSMVVSGETMKELFGEEALKSLKLENAKIQIFQQASGDPESDHNQREQALNWLVNLLSGNTQANKAGDQPKATTQASVESTSPANQ